MSYKRIQIAMLCGVTALSSGAVYGQTCKSGSGMGSGMSSGMKGTNFSMHDKMFLKKSAEGNMAEIKTAHIALDKSQSEDVKDFAQKMIDDHTKLSDQMKPFMEKAGVPEPTKLNSEDAMMDKKLSGMSGDAFDKQYITAMVKDHHKDLGEFKTEVSSTKNEDLKSSVTQGEQVIQEHVTMIDGIAQKHGISAPHPGSM